MATDWHEPITVHNETAFRPSNNKWRWCVTTCWLLDFHVLTDKQTG